MIDSSRLGGVRRGLACATALLIGLAANGVSANAVDDLTAMSLEELMGLEVTSVSKKRQTKSDVAAAVTVITAEDIRRGGFTVIPEALRTVPGLQVARVDASRWSISVRGFNSLFANKLLVLIDGRSVYNPTFGGTYWDAQDYPIEDVERIEVIRGPGGTVWGVNAVNGVINIITKHAKDTQGTLISAYGGSREHGATARFGGQVDEHTHYRVYARGFAFQDQDIDKSYDGKDEWRQARLGFRTDTQVTDQDTLRVSGDFYDIDKDIGVFNPNSLVAPGEPAFNRLYSEQRGGNVLLDWEHAVAEDNNIGVTGYYSFDKHEFLLTEEIHSVALDAQHDFVAFEDVVEGVVGDVAVSWGGDYRYSTAHNKVESFTIDATLDPNDVDVHIANGFAQIQVGMYDDLITLIGGTKLGYHSWSGFEYQPSGRIVVKPYEGHAVWGAVSRAVRTPTQVDRDVRLVLPSTLGSLQLDGNRDFRSEELLAFELGYRFFALEKFNAELSLFWNEYESLTSLEDEGFAFPPPTQLTTFGNESEVTSRGAELELNFMPFEWWRIRTSYSYVHLDEEAGPGTLDLGASLDDQNPSHQFNIQTFFDLPLGFEFDASLYYVDGLPGVTPSLEANNVEQYIRLDLRLGYKPADWVEIALVGQNLTDRRHYESNDFTLSQSTQVPRSGYAKVTFNF